MSENQVRQCRVCGHEEENRRFIAREMYFGWKDPFEYFECADCGCVQIATIPEDLGKYYPPDYYSFSRPARIDKPVVPGWRKLRNRALLGQAVPFRALITRLSPGPGYFSWFHGLSLRLDSNILDVGCGAGSLLLRMRRAGFANLTGVDPYIAEEIDYGDGLKILKADYSSLNERFDLVMSHHSFEHMPDPLRSLSDMAGLLKPGGALLIRIPVAGGYAWRKYRQHLVSLDPPRHLHLHTIRSMALLAAACGLSIDRVFYDSDAQQITTSELYLRGIAQKDAALHMGTVFSSKEMAEIYAFVKKLNARRDGDTAVFVLRRTRQS
jgi:SAM-dependent methyltransferase